jgi:hypothetical protein
VGAFARRCWHKCSKVSKVLRYSPYAVNALNHYACRPHTVCDCLIFLLTDPRVDGALLHTALLHHTLAENKNFLLPLDHDRLNKIQTASGRSGILGGGGVLGAVPCSFFLFFWPWRRPCGRTTCFGGCLGVGLDWILLYRGQVHVCGSWAGKCRVFSGCKSD